MAFSPSHRWDLEAQCTFLAAFDADVGFLSSMFLSFKSLFIFYLYLNHIKLRIFPPGFLLSVLIFSLVAFWRTGTLAGRRRSHFWSAETNRSRVKSISQWADIKCCCCSDLSPAVAAKPRQAESCAGVAWLVNAFCQPLVLNLSVTIWPQHPVNTLKWYKQLLLKLSGRRCGVGKTSKMAAKVRDKIWSTVIPHITSLGV